ncbi:MAG: tRNA uridine-5-carboxymethylaminomethyl(34) synthesis GTPase MnmE [Endozoicomonadaceae bacterium]|nr:tRNA uridine-5-carboxymethylaminomethyl(34) synthesis GTPase MnmE [Endozoicomonadaceae bacterium]
MMEIDTIVALATPPGRGGVSIIRISGPKTSTIIQTVLKKTMIPRYATYLPFYDIDCHAIDQGIALWFPAPFSLTGDDVLELQGHGGPIVVQLLIKTILQLDVRLAKPGEFLERAFLNGKIDLAQAEATADLIDSVSEVAVKSAVKSMQGQFSNKINHIIEALIKLRVYIEASIDFPEEEVDFLADQYIDDQLNDIDMTLDRLIQTANQGSLSHSGATVVLAGQPNAGKSSVLNALVGNELAIVTEVAGTTRDLIRDVIHLDGLKINLIDTAGLRKSDDPVEKIGINKAMKVFSEADCILLIADSQTYSKETIQLASHILPEQLRNQGNILYIRNKIDLVSENPELNHIDNYSIINISAKMGTGIDLLKKHIKASLGFQDQAPNTFSARQRHLNQLNKALKSIRFAKNQFNETAAGELLAEDLRVTQNALNEITGHFSADDLLGRIFSEFCMGK